MAEGRQCSMVGCQCSMESRQGSGKDCHAVKASVSGMRATAGTGKIKSASIEAREEVPEQPRVQRFLPLEMILDADSRLFLQTCGDVVGKRWPVGEVENLAFRYSDHRDRCSASLSYSMANALSGHRRSHLQMRVLVRFVELSVKVNDISLFKTGRGNPYPPWRMGRQRIMVRAVSIGDADPSKMY